MAKRGGQGVGHVGRLGEPFQGKFALHRPLHLLLGCAPAARDCLLMRVAL
jgi:hypothetical protein